MAHLFNSLETEVTKYKDIGNILSKLQEDGEIQNLFDSFKDIFENEYNFTMQELSRIEDEKKTKLNIQEQCENNLSLFKCNFQLIVSMILDKAFKATFADSKKGSQNFESTRAETMENLTMTHILPETPKKKTKKAKTKRVSSPPRGNMLDLSLVNKTPKSSKNKKMNSISQLSASQTQSPLAKIFGNNSTIIGKEKSFNQSINQSITPSQINTPKRQSRALNQTISSVGRNSNSFVQSEFNYITGPVTFPKSPKREESPHCSPGPAMYNTDVSSFRSLPCATIGNAPKKCWIDEHVARIDSPGAGGRYYSHHFLSK